jgi:type II secretory pathway pseudopilin PulG
MKLRNSVALVFRPRGPSGITLLEILVACGIVSLLVSLLLPALMRSRAAARRVVCMNHLRQLALAMNMHVDQQGRYPASGNFEASGPRQYHNWVVAILPQLDQGALFQKYDLTKPCLDSRNLDVTGTPIAVLTCPDDISLEEGQGNLSYVVNGGLSWTIPIDCPANLHANEQEATISPLDLNGDGVLCPIGDERESGTPDVELLRRTSLFFVENWPGDTGTHRFHRLQDVSDGLTQTLLLSENVRAGYDLAKQTNWGSPEPPRNAFFISSYVCESGNCSRENVHLARANDAVTEPYRRESLNAALDQAEGTAPWPSSGHSLQVHFAWCDGRTTAISQSIDGAVYFAMATPQGMKGGEVPLHEPIVNAAEF